MCAASSTRIELKAGEELAVILNNLGGTSKLEEQTRHPKFPLDKLIILQFKLSNLFVPKIGRKGGKLDC